MASRKQKKAQLRLLNEIRDQLVLQAERWGLKGFYTQVCLDEMTLDQSRRIAGDLLSEKNNLEYELFMIDSDKKELLIKLERLQNYIRKAHKMIDKYEKSINKQVNRYISDGDKLELILRRLRPEGKISVMVSSN